MNDRGRAIIDIENSVLDTPRDIENKRQLENAVKAYPDMLLPAWQALPRHVKEYAWAYGLPYPHDYSVEE